MKKLRISEGLLYALLDHIRGAGRLPQLGVSTYPDGPELEQLHLNCLELERRGLIFRYLDLPDLVIWFSVRE
jgi:hypothetical protein